METYRLKSKLLENDKAYTIQTSNDPNLLTVSSMIYVNDELTETVRCPHPADICSEEILSLVKIKHGETKREVEGLLEAYRRVTTDGDSQEIFHLGTAFYYKCFYREARRLLTIAVKLDSKSHQALNYLGMTLLALGEYPEAVKEASRAVKERPGYADYHSNLGEACLANGSCKRAVIEFEEAIRINLYYSDAYFNLGLALVLNALKHEDTALFDSVLSKSADYFKKAALIYPEYNTNAYQEGLKFLADSDLERAYGLLTGVRDEKRERHRQEFASFYMKYVMYPECVSENSMIDRITFLRAEIDKNPTYVDLYAELGRCYLEQAKLSWQKGVDQYKRALQMNSSLSKIGGNLDDAEKEYGSICRILSRLVEKG